MSMIAGKDYGVRVIRAYDMRRVGQVFYPPGALRQALVYRGFVERVQPPEEDQAEGSELPLAPARERRASRR